ncbi:hypothetical protein [Marinobacter xestospongiae]|uniref:Lipoprotein n=1 Tax=Marinobacter xestospongiae TaxID=994319 RepID=A0ABU3VTD0_9GAMM|nr:hypothetical protein [Marinobacter xestospongiae]MDV2077539.1 hypothetical protein [Marinobacter xestospongiae]
MKIHHFMAATFFLSGCASGPRPYDGVLGYRTEPLPVGIQVTYVDEADSSTEEILSHISVVCNDALGPSATAPSVEVKSVTEYDRQVGMSVPIPVGVETIGSYSSGGGTPTGATIQSSVTQTDTVFRNITLKKVVALCATAP